MVTYNDTLLKENKVDFRKMNQIALDAAREGYGELFTHIIIDESQDLTKTQLEFIKCIYKDKKYSSLLFVADNTQSIYSHSWLGKGRPYTTLGYDMSGKSRKLSKNYRTTTQISEAAYSLIDKDESIKNNIDYVKPSLIDRHGHAPIYRHFKDRKEHEDFISNEISILKNDYSLSEIAVVAKERRLLENIKVLFLTVKCWIMMMKELLKAMRED
jgi:superfamily I DNA/RNA helicase